MKESQAVEGSCHCGNVRFVAKLANDLELVPREEFEAMRAIALKAQADVEALTARVIALENKPSTGS